LEAARRKAPGKNHSMNFFVVSLGADREAEDYGALTRFAEVVVSGKDRLDFNSDPPVDFLLLPRIIFAVPTTADPEPLQKKDKFGESVSTNIRRFRFLSRSKYTLLMAYNLCRKKVL
jgi:hypothetical protein